MIAIASLGLAAALATPRPDVPPIEDRPPGIYYRRLSSASERRIYWRGMTRQQGYFEIVIPGYSQMFTQIKSAPRTEKKSICSLPSQYRLEWSTRETPNRFSSLYTDSQGRRYVLTAWNFLNDHATIEVIEDFLNGQVAGNPATFTLVKSGLRRTDGVWKLTWATGSTQIELYVEAAGAPELENLKRVAGTISCAAD